MNNLTEMLFSPLSKDYCVWFYGWTIFSYFWFIIVLISSIVYGIKQKKGMEYYFMSTIAALAYFLIYFQYRLLYSMCVK